MKLLSVAGLGIVLAVAVGCHGKEAPPPPPPPPAVVVTPVVQRDVPVYQEWIGTTRGQRQRRDPAEGRRLSAAAGLHRGELRPPGRAALRDRPAADPGAAPAGAGGSGAGPGPARPRRSRTSTASARSPRRRRSASRSSTTRCRPRGAAQGGGRTPRAGGRAPGAPQPRLDAASPRRSAASPALRQAQVGNLVSPSTVLATVSQCRSDPRPLSAQRAGVPAACQERLRQEPAARARQPASWSSPTARSSRTRGACSSPDRQVDVKTGTIATVGLFPNPGNLLRPGQYAKVRAVTEVKKGAILVPQRAVNELQGGFQVAVVGADDKAEIRTVKPGERVGKLWVDRLGTDAGRPRRRRGVLAGQGGCRGPAAGGPGGSGRSRDVRARRPRATPGGK